MPHNTHPWDQRMQDSSTGHENCPERNLVVAVIQKAIDDYITGDHPASEFFLKPNTGIGCWAPLIGLNTADVCSAIRKKWYETRDDREEYQRLSSIVATYRSQASEEEKDGFLRHARELKDKAKPFAKLAARIHRDLIRVARGGFEDEECQ